MIQGLVAVLTVALAVAAWWTLKHARRRNVRLWLPSYLRGNWAGRREKTADGPTHILFCIADHFEPALFDVDQARRDRRVEHWLTEYPKLANRFRDSDGFPPRHTFFFPAEQYNPRHMDALAQLVSARLGEVEIHLHHDADTSEGLREKLLAFKAQLRSHGHLGNEASGEVRFGFVHGNWALDNSSPDGRWCGVNDELRVLRECGCYADFTLPSAPSPTQTKRINSIYYAQDDPQRPRSHDDGAEARAGLATSGDLLLIQGPLLLRWPGKLGIFPRLDAGNLAGNEPPSPRRLAGWIRTRVCVAGRTDWVFVKVHTHGCFERNWSALLGEAMQRLHGALQAHYNDGVRYRLHYATAREMYNVVRAVERGLGGDPGQYRDLEIVPPPAGAKAAARARLTVETAS